MMRTHGTLLVVVFLSPVFSQTRPSISAVATASAFGAYQAVAAPGSYVEIYGSNLAGTTRGWTTADFTAAGAPTSLDGVSVSVNGTPAYVSYVSPTQVNAEVPDGVSASVVSVTVSYQNQTSPSVSLTINTLEPGLLAPATFNISGRQYGAAVHSATGAFVSETAPAIPGETLIFYGIGFGPIAQGKVAGEIATGQTSLVDPFSMTIGGSPAAVQYAGGPASGTGPGVYQFNVVVPASLSAGDLAIQFALNGSPVILQTLFLPVGSTNSTSVFTLTSSAGVNGGTLSGRLHLRRERARPFPWRGPTRLLEPRNLALLDDHSARRRHHQVELGALRHSLLATTSLASRTPSSSEPWEWAAMAPARFYHLLCSQRPRRLKLYTLHASTHSSGFTCRSPCVGEPGDRPDGHRRHRRHHTRLDVPESGRRATKRRAGRAQPRPDPRFHEGFEVGPGDGQLRQDLWLCGSTASPLSP